MNNKIIIFIIVVLLIILLLLVLFNKTIYTEIYTFFGLLFTSVVIFFRPKEYIQGGSRKPLFNNIGKTKYKFKFNKFLDIPEVTAMSFINDHIIVITKPGDILYVDNGIEQIMDMRNDPNFTSKDTEQGLLGITIDNTYTKIYLSYTINSDNPNYAMELLVDEYNFNNKTLTKTKNIISIPFRTTYHHSGTLEFGPDKKLYLSTGDGGPQNDPYNESQNLNSYRGKILKIDVDTLKVKIIASGLRNPWKFSFDDIGRIWIGDVGYNSIEEIDLISSPNKFYNFGWSYFEGSRQNKPGKKFTDFDCPIWEYKTSDSTGRSVIGGYFLSSLNIYVFGDYLGFIRAIEFDHKDGKWKQIAENKLNNKNEKIYSLGYSNTNIYVTTDKKIYKVDIIFLF